MDSGGIKSYNKNEIKVRYKEPGRLCLNPEFVKSQLKLLLQSPTFQTDIKKIFRDSLPKNKRFIKKVSITDDSPKNKLPIVPRSKNYAKILKRAKMKAKRRSSGFHTNIYFKNNYLVDNSKIKLLNDEFEKEIASSWKDNVLKAPSSAYTSCQKQCQTESTALQIHDMIYEKDGYITKCIEAALNGYDSSIIFETIVTAAILNIGSPLISIMKDSVLSLTPMHLSIRTPDISKSVKLSNFTIKEISIDEFHQIIIINDSIRLCNFCTNNDLQRLLVLLEYLIRKNANQRSSDEEKSVSKLMLPCIWNNLLKCKERICYVNTNVKVTWYIYALQNSEEIEEEIISGALLTRSRNENRVQANFKFYGCSNTSVMEKSIQEISEFQCAYFEVK